MSLDYDPQTGELPLTNGHAKPTRQPQPAPEPRPTSLGQALYLASRRIQHLIDATADSQFKNKDGSTRKYANLSDILGVVRPILLEHGIRIRQGEHQNFPCDDGGGKGRLSIVYTDLVYDMTGEFERTILHVPYLKMDGQGAGSALTYGRRYTLVAALGLATGEGDDDGASTKRGGIGDQVIETKAVRELKKEIADCKDMTDLVDWSEDPKRKARLDRLTAEELALLRVAYKARADEIASPKK